MSISLNKLQLIGNVGKAPEIRATSSGKKVANFSVATSRLSHGNEVTDWHRCTAWGKTADIVEQYVGRGERVYIEGELQYGSYEKDGQTVKTTDVNVWRVILLGGGQRQEEQRPAPALTEPDDDLPF